MKIIKTAKIEIEIMEMNTSDKSILISATTTTLIKIWIIRRQ